MVTSSRLTAWLTTEYSGKALSRNEKVDDSRLTGNIEATDGKETRILVMESRRRACERWVLYCHMNSRLKILQRSPAKMPWTTIGGGPL